MNDVIIRPAASEYLGNLRTAVWFHAVKRNDRLSLVGWSRLEVGYDAKLWFAVSVEAPCRGGGIGRALLAAACAWADRHEAEIYLTSKPHLVGWYASAGFERLLPWDGFSMADGQTLMKRACVLTSVTL